MIAITLEYKLFGFLWHRRIDTKMPARWSELSAPQIIALADFMSGKIEESDLVQIFLGLSRRIAKKIDSYQRFCITRHLKYLSKLEPSGIFIVPSIGKLKCPGRNFTGVTFGAFVFGDTYYMNYLAGDKTALDKFIACYYTGKGGFDQKLIEANSLLISKASPAIKEAISMNYGMIRQWLALTYTYVFQKSSQAVSNDKTPAWVKVFDKVVGRDIVHQNDYALLPATEVLRFLNEVTKDYYKNGGKV